MTKLEERIRSGLDETAERIPESTDAREVIQARPWRLTGAWIGAAAVIAVLVLFSPLFFMDGSGPAVSEPVPDRDVTPAVVGFEFANPEHVSLRFTQELTLICQGLETIDDDGFDSFDMDIWIDHDAGYTRLGFEYPDGSTHDLILEGRPGEWERAWGSGADLGRNAGCRETFADGSYSTSVAGWAHQDASELWFTAYLKPVTPGDDGAVVDREGTPTPVTAVGPDTYVYEEEFPGGSNIRHEYLLDEPRIRVIGESRSIHIPDNFEAIATIEVLESGPATLPADIFDTSGFTPLWGGDPVATTKATTP